MPKTEKEVIKMLHKITIIGCDDENEIDVELTLPEVNFLKSLKTKFNRENMSGCVPTLEISLLEIKK